MKLKRHHRLVAVEWVATNTAVVEIDREVGRGHLLVRAEDVLLDGITAYDDGNEITVAVNPAADREARRWG